MLSFVFSDWSRVTYFANALAYRWTWPYKPLRMFLFVPTRGDGLVSSDPLAVLRASFVQVPTYNSLH